MIETETWEWVPGYVGRYQVSTLGRVMSFVRKQPRLLKQNLVEGYPMVAFTTGKRDYRHFKVATLVIVTFRGPRPEGLIVLHNDGNRGNSRLDNLRYGTYPENMADRIKHGTHPHQLITECPAGHDYDEENTYWYGNHRFCRACHRASERRRKYGS